MTPPHLPGEVLDRDQPETVESTPEGDGPAVGGRLREYRRNADLTMQEVAERTGLSKSFVSQVESGRVSPSLQSLKRIADALSVTLSTLFATGPGGDAERISGGDLDRPDNALATATERLRRRGRELLGGEAVVVRHDRRRKIAWPGSKMVTYMLTPDRERRLEVVMSIVPPNDSVSMDFIAHEGEECGIVLEGRYEVHVGERVYTLEAGDSIYYPSQLPHRARAIGDTPVTVLWITTPPFF